MSAPSGPLSPPPTAASKSASAEEVHADVLHDLVELYEGRATREMLSRRFTGNATYEDAWVRSCGRSEIAALFRLVHAGAPAQAVLARRVLSPPWEVYRIVLWLRTRHGVLGLRRTSEAIVVIELDEQRRIVSMVQTAHGRAPPAHWGAGAVRRLGGRAVALVPWVSFGGGANTSAERPRHARKASAL